MPCVSAIDICDDMSTITKKSNGRYLARWRDPSGKQCCRTFDRKIDATNFLSTVTVDTM